MFTKFNRVVILGAGPAGLAAARVALFEFGIARVEMYDQGKHPLPSYSSCLAPLLNFQNSTGGIGGSTSGGWGGQLAELSLETLSEWQSHDNGFSEDAIKALRLASAELVSDFDLIKMNSELIEINPIFEDMEGNQINKSYTYYSEEKNLEIRYRDVINDSRFSLVEKRVTRIDCFENCLKLFSNEELIEIPENTLLIIALGCIETTQIILRSFPIAAHNFQVGVGVRDHPATYLYTFKTKRFATDTPNFGQFVSRKVKYEVCSKFGGRNRRPGIFEVQEIHNQFILNGELQLKKLTSTELFRNKLKSAFRHFLPTTVFNFLFVREFVIWAQLEQAPDESRLLFLKGDYIASTWQLNSSDIQGFAEVAKISKDWLDTFQLEFGCVIDLDSLIELPVANFQAAHPSGTIKVNNERDLAIADCYGRMHDYPQIVIASSAIFPSDGWMNPTLAVMAYSISATRKALGN